MKKPKWDDEGYRCDAKGGRSEIANSLTSGWLVPGCL